MGVVMAINPKNSLSISYLARLKTLLDVRLWLVLLNWIFVLILYYNMNNYFYNKVAVIMVNKFIKFVVLALLNFSVFASNIDVNCNKYTKEQIAYSRSNNNLFLEKISSNCSYTKGIKYPDILLIHGLTYSSHQFDLDYKDYSMANFLASQGYRVWLLDVTGYGQSQKPLNGFIVNSDYAAKDIKGAVDLILAKEHTSKVNLLGWSAGTITSSKMVKLDPHVINSLVLYAPIYHAHGVSVPQTSYQKFTDAADISDFQKESQNGNVNFNIVESAVVNQYLIQSRKYDGSGSPNGIRKEISQPTALFDPKALNVPVLVIVGTKDGYIDRTTDIPYMMSVMPNKNNQLVVIDGGSHMMMLEMPYYHIFQNSVLEFLNKNNAAN